MEKRLCALISVVISLGIASAVSVAHYPSQEWLHFALYLAAVLLSSGMKVGLAKLEVTMSVNFPFLLLGIVQLSPLQAIALALCSVLVLCNWKVIKPFTIVQTVFNLANVTTSVVGGWYCYTRLVGHGVEKAPALAIASLLYFLINSVPITLIMAWDSRLDVVTQWRKAFLWYVPFYLVGAIIAAAANFISLRIGWSTSLLIFPLVYTIYRAYISQTAALSEREQHLVENKALQLRTIEGLAMAIEAKDENTHQHLMRVRVYVTELAEMMDLEDDIKQALTTASFLHDIGKLAVPEYIINKPGKLTREEFAKMKTHPVVGADILERVRFPYPVVPIVRSHHESWDGSGYPDGLKGEEIPIGARLLSAVDCFDALASDRPYRKAMSLDAAMAFVKSKAGTQFDPAIVDLLSRHYEMLETKARHELSSMEPLKTGVFVERGAAPGAGFEEHAGDPAASRKLEDMAPKTSDGAAFLLLDRIAAANLHARAIFQLSRIPGSSLSVRDASAMMAQRLKPLIDHQCLGVYLKSSDHLKVQFMDGECASAFCGLDLPIGEGLSGWVAQSGRPIVNGNPTVEQHYLAGSANLTAGSSSLSIPLFDLNKDVFGVLTLYATAAAAFSKDDLRVLLAVESRFSLSLLNAMCSNSGKTVEKLDFLAGLPSRRAFLETLENGVEDGQRTGSRFAIAVCDITSDADGQSPYLTGDELLRRFAEQFRSVCEAGDVVAHMGENELVFLVQELDGTRAEARARIEAEVQQAVQQVQQPAFLEAAVGVAFYPEDGETGEALLGAADRSLSRHRPARRRGPEAQSFKAGLEPNREASAVAYGGSDHGFGLTCSYRQTADSLRE